MLERWKNKKIGILGFGIEGITTAEFLLKNGISFTILDKKNEQEIDQEILDKFKQQSIPFIFGSTYLIHLTEFDIIIRSQGIRLLKTELQEAQQKGVVITSQTKMFFDICPCPIIGVTGTKGKGTTSSLIYHMLKKSGKDAYLGGNIGVPPLTFLDTLTAGSLVVLELSSFQLQDLTKSPHIGVMLMVTQEHLDAFGDRNYHSDIMEYIDAKRNILRFQTQKDYAIINRDYPASNESDMYTKGQVYFVSRERKVERGCFIKEDAVYMRKDDKDDKIIDIKDIALPGRHNLENVCAAVMAATLTGTSNKAIVSVLKSFKGLEHRLELVIEINGVQYYDDSFSTTPETAIAAIEAFQQPEILILGGSNKGSDFSELGRVISHTPNIRAIIGIGEEWKRIKERITNRESRITIIENCKNMKEILLEASEIAEAGDVVLLSPACASYDMFKDYKDRGEQFKEAVLNLRIRNSI